MTPKSKSAYLLTAGAIALLALLIVPTSATTFAPVAPGVDVMGTSHSRGPILDHGLPGLPAVTPDVWTEFQHDTNNSGRSANNPVPSTLAWNVSLPTLPSAALTPYVGSPVVGYGNVYIPEGNAIFAYNASEGTLVWNRTLTPDAGGTGFVVAATPLLWNGWLVVSQDYQTLVGPSHPACGGAPHCSYVYIMDARTGLNLAHFAPDPAGALWSGNLVPSSPIPLGPSQFSGHTGFLLLDDAGYAYTFEWNGTALVPVGSSVTAVANYGRNERTTSTPAIAYIPGGGWAAISLDAANNRLDALNLSNATNLPYLAGYPLNVPLGLGGGITVTFAGGTESSSVSVANLSTAGGAFPVAFFGDNHGAATTSYLVAVNLSNAKAPLDAVTPLSATGAANDGVLSAPALLPMNNTSVGLIVSDLNGSVSRWNYTAPIGGTAKFTLDWEDSLGNPQSSALSPAIAGGTVYYANSTGTVFALNATTGAIAWQANTTADIRSSFALAYDRLYVLSDPTNLAGKGAELSAYGAAPPPVLKIVSTSYAPDPVASGGSTTIKVNVTTGPALGPRTPATGATVNATFPIGTPRTQSALTNANGTATFSWSAPPVSPVEYNISVALEANQTGAVSTSSSMVITVLSGGTSGSGLSAMIGSISPVNSTITPGQWQNLTLTVDNATGVPVNGATAVVTLHGPGTVVAQPGPTVNGKAVIEVRSNLNLAVSQPILVGANVSAGGYANAYAAAVIEVSVSPVIAPPGASPLAATILPGTLTLWTGNVTKLTVTVENASSKVRIVNASVSLSLTSGTGTSVSPATTTTNATGIATFTLTAGSTPGAVLVTAVVRATAYNATSAFASLSVIARPATPSTSQNNTAPSSSSLTAAELLLVGLVILLVIALALALARRRGPSTPPTSKDSVAEEEKPTEGSEAPKSTAEEEGKPAGPTAEEEKPEEPSEPAKESTPETDTGDSSQEAPSPAPSSSEAGKGTEE